MLRSPAQNIYSSKDTITGRYKAQKLKGEEIAYVDQVRGLRVQGRQGFLIGGVHGPSWAVIAPPPIAHPTPSPPRSAGHLGGAVIPALLPCLPSIP